MYLLISDYYLKRKSRTFIGNFNRSSFADPFLSDKMILLRNGMQRHLCTAVSSLRCFVLFFFFQNNDTHDQRFL